ncbi:hypothetical protein BKA58DRAFT_450033 [Alternaria rosae]|uniref:uncharacterized protein n=1 Tax=Alternaria rosae TaxID=1187941 RepID=UPI001E8E7894|nr:uncharacterized protein BKA58DRAFT_450033 [Alternaria rosae]KAH6857465.1 hypothetical protein BKA58DRAFT_450033 [Alternaria rosae]
MFFARFILASLTIATAAANLHFHSPNPHAFGKRQEYQPPVNQCGIGDTCEASCGTGYLLCSDPDTFLCYNPDMQETCCEAGSSASWGCPNGDYCLIDGWCCPQGLDPQACALSLSVSLPATFVGPTATISLSNMTSPITTPTAASTSVSALVSTSLPEFTGAASPNTFAGGHGLLYTVLLLFGGLF